MVGERGGCDSLQMEITPTASHGAKAFRWASEGEHCVSNGFHNVWVSSPLPLKGSGGRYFHLRAAQGYWLPNHPLGRAAGPDAVAKFEICWNGDGATAKFELRYVIEKRAAPLGMKGIYGNWDWWFDFWKVFFDGNVPKYKLLHKQAIYTLGHN